MTSKAGPAASGCGKSKASIRNGNSTERFGPSPRGAWYLQSSSQVDVAIQIELATVAEAVLEPAASNSPKEVADLIDGYNGMSRAEKSKAVRTLLRTTQDRAVSALLSREYANLMSDGAEHANKRFKGVVPNGWPSTAE